MNLDFFSLEKRRKGCGCGCVCVSLAAPKQGLQRRWEILLRAAQQKDRTKWSLLAKRENLTGHKEEVCQRESGSTCSHKNSLPTEIMESPFGEISEVG